MATDFLSYTPEGPYDVIVMNPPFSVEGDKLAYVTHIEHAWSMLKEGGHLVAVVPPGWLYGSVKRVASFREFVCEHLDFQEVGAGVFKESGTMVNTFIWDWYQAK